MPDHASTTYAVLDEDPTGVIGAPMDETDFEFEPELAGAAEPEITGVPEGLVESMRERVAPWMDVARVRLVGFAPDGPMVITRADGSAQAHVLHDDGRLQRLTNEREPVSQAAWHTRPEGVVYRVDRSGDEQHQIFFHPQGEEDPRRVSTGTGRFGPFRLRGTHLVATGSGRNETDMDVFWGDVESLERRVVREGTWVVSSIASEGVLLLREYLSFTRERVWYLSGGRATALGDEQERMRDGRFGPDRRHVFLLSDRGGELVGLHRFDLRTGEMRALTEDLPHAVESLAVVQGLRRVVFVVDVDGRSRLFVLDADSLERRELDLPMPAIISSLTTEGSRLALSLDDGTKTPSTWQLDLERDVWTPMLGGASPAEARSPEPVRFTSFDELEIRGWLWMPADATDESPAPTLVWMHGGPEQASRPSYHPFVQFLVTQLGIAVVMPNIRGSDGRGRTFVSLDDGMRRTDAVRDIGATLDFVAETPSLDAERVAIYGASYGGAMVLSALVEYSDRLVAGCDQVGMSSYVSFLENTRAYRRDARRAEYGDERDPEMRAFLESISPLRNAGRIRAPLFVAHGEHDPRVPVGEARQIVEEVRANGVPVWTFIAPDEGHSFQKKHNRDAFYAHLAAFLQLHLAERATPFDASPEDPPTQSEP